MPELRQAARLGEDINGRAAALADNSVSVIVVKRSGSIARSVLALGRSTPSLTAMERPFERGPAWLLFLSPGRWRQVREIA